MEGHQGCPLNVSSYICIARCCTILMSPSCRTLLEAAEKLKWPMKVDYASASPEDRKAFETAFYNLLKLQTIGEKIHDSSEHKAGRKEGIYPIQALVRGIALRFKFHFEGSRPTNRLDKVGWLRLLLGVGDADGAISIAGVVFHPYRQRVS